MTTVAAYLRVSTDGQVESGLGLDAQRAKIEDEAARRGWTVLYFVDEGFSGKNGDRPALKAALAALKAGECTTLVVAKMDRLARSVLQASDVLETARKQKWSVAVLDLGMSLDTPHGKAMAQMLAVFAELEREMISARTREALAQCRARGQRLGRPRETPDAVVAQVLALAATGLSPHGVAKALSAEGVPTTRGAAQWRASTVRRVIRGAALDAAVNDSHGSQEGVA
jgi:DNA invertase Pin-like site-specific DNA recombinase